MRGDLPKSADQDRLSSQPFCRGNEARRGAPFVMLATGCSIKCGRMCGRNRIVQREAKVKAAQEKDEEFKGMQLATLEIRVKQVIRRKNQELEENRNCRNGEGRKKGSQVF